MGPDESRLRCMLDPNGLWGLSSEDRQAIQWAFDRIKTLEEDLHRSREQQIEVLREGNRQLGRVRDLMTACQRCLDTRLP
jgi:hypothetical protein